MDDERFVQTYLKINWKKIFPNSFHLLGTDWAISGCYSQKRIGLADFMFRVGKNYYACEMKWNKDECVLNSLKAIGYAKSNQLATGKTTHPVAIIPKEWFTNDIRALFYEIGLKYILVCRNVDGFFVEYDLGR